MFRWMDASEDSEALLKPRLEAGLPTLFFLRSPHQALGLYPLHRIQLPMYKADLFADGRADFPTEVWLLGGSFSTV